MNLPGELIDHQKLLIETSTGVVEVDLGLFKSPNRWFIVQLGQRIIAGSPGTISREQIQDGMQGMGWPKVTTEVD